MPHSAQSCVANCGKRPPSVTDSARVAECSLCRASYGRHSLDNEDGIDKPANLRKAAADASGALAFCVIVVI